MNLSKEQQQFSVQVYGDLVPYNNVLSQARCRIFYKGMNRNGTYITEEFANKLLSTLPYVPVKGIFSYSEDDYADHGVNRDQGKIYGIVPENPNVQWETHLDEDGVERTYACADVLLFTAIYKEASQILGKSQSMELYANSIEGSWEIVGGQKCFKFENACFLGLQVLGEEVEPCFEGAAFFSHYDKLEEVVKKLEKYNLQSGGENMEKEFKEIFKLSDTEKARLIWDLVNTNDMGEYYDICDVYDQYAICYEYSTSQFFRVYYTKDDSTDSLTIDDKEVVYMMDITEAEKAALDVIRVMNGDTYAELDKKYQAKIDECAEAQEKADSYSTSLEGAQAELETLTQEHEALKAEFAEKEAKVIEQIDKFAVEAQTLTDTNKELSETIESQAAQIEELEQFKYQVVTQEKMSEIDRYAEYFDSEHLDSYRAKVDEYTIEELKKDLAFDLVTSKPSIFSVDETVLIPKDEQSTGGIEEILAKYKD